MNFFGDKHGKNNRDTHFSVISRFIQAESLVKKIYSTQDIVDAIHKRQELANQNLKGSKCLIGFFISRKIAELWCLEKCHL